ncbi:MAG: hypothetical protein AAF206_27955 [Bacteroidota bacterium]
MKTTFLFVVSLLLISQVFGQKEELVPLDSIRFSGRVLDKENGEPLAFTNILVYQGDTFLTGAKADTSGRFRISYPVAKTNGEQIIIKALYLKRRVEAFGSGGFAAAHIAELCNPANQHLYMRRQRDGDIECDRTARHPAVVIKAEGQNAVGQRDIVLAQLGQVSLERLASRVSAPRAGTKPVGIRITHC